LERPDRGLNFLHSLSEWSFTLPVQYRKENQEDVQESNVPQRRLAAIFPPEVGKLSVVTASTSGIGFDVALALAQAGADVIVAGRHTADGHEALAKIRPLAPNALVRFEKLDLESLNSVADFAGRLAIAGRPVDLLINNVHPGIAEARSDRRWI
jgi:hypothetical protein